MMGVAPARSPPGPCPRILQGVRWRLGGGPARKRELPTPLRPSGTARKRRPRTRRCWGWRRS
eukprot:3691275-Alexandrium_andersonii.AAC.1